MRAHLMLNGRWVVALPVTLLLCTAAWASACSDKGKAPAEGQSPARAPAQSTAEPVQPAVQPAQPAAQPGIPATAQLPGTDQASPNEAPQPRVVAQPSSSQTAPSGGAPATTEPSQPAPGGQAAAEPPQPAPGSQAAAKPPQPAPAGASSGEPPAVQPSGADAPSPPPTPAAAHGLTFSQPAAFACGAEITWKDLKDWKGSTDPSICRTEPYYTIRGTAKGAAAGAIVKAAIFVPDAQQSWPASGGGLLNVEAGTGAFSGSFCIPQKGPAREFWFELFQEDGTRIGDKCVIKVGSLF